METELRQIVLKQDKIIRRLLINFKKEETLSAIIAGLTFIVGFIIGGALL